MVGRNTSSSKAEMAEKDKDRGAAAAIAMAVGVAAVVGAAAVAAWGLSKLLGSTEPEPPHGQKMMKAPGRDYFMPRNDFEKNPSDYFRDLRGKKY
ncbi:hypothetical protein OROGR_002045 [Orobanche gracilis]